MELVSLGTVYRATGYIWIFLKLPNTPLLNSLLMLPVLCKMLQRYACANNLYPFISRRNISAINWTLKSYNVSCWISPKRSASWTMQRFDLLTDCIWYNKVLLVQMMTSQGIFGTYFFLSDLMLSRENFIELERNW